MYKNIACFTDYRTRLYAVIFKFCTLAIIKVHYSKVVGCFFVCLLVSYSLLIVFAELSIFSREDSKYIFFNFRIRVSYNHFNNRAFVHYLACYFTLEWLQNCYKRQKQQRNNCFYTNTFTCKFSFFISY